MASSAAQSSSMASRLASSSLLALSTAAALAASRETAHADVVQIGDLPEGSVTLEASLNKGKDRAAPLDLPGGPDSLATFAWGTPLCVPAPVEHSPPPRAELALG